MATTQQIKTYLLRDIFDPGIDVEYFDSRILDYVNNMKPEKKSFADLSEAEITEAILSNNLKINNQSWEFTVKYYFENRVKIHLPAWFIEMPGTEEAAVAYTDANDSVKFKLAYTKIPHHDKHNETFQQSLINELKAANPDVNVLEASIVKINGKNIGLHHVAAGNDYIFIFFASLLGKAVKGEFHYLQENQEIWQKVFKGMLNTLRVSIVSIQE